MLPMSARDSARALFAERLGVLSGHGEARYWNDYFGVGCYSGVDF